ncbi:M48 family metallopeptidase [Nonomuraea sp. B12E4]|uniref:M48 family metallopeptidase n=1 Tax=Nonomuraea sp. B12E4 TaxID=3153564 RepID=UPI00325ED158
MKRASALVLALVVHLLTLGFAVLGGWAILAHSGFLLAWLLGGLCLAIAWTLRPRLDRLPADAEVLDRASAPELYAVAERVADRAGVKRPAKVAVRDLATRTRYGLVGLSRTPVLVVGLPLWLALPPRQRVALLATAYARMPTGAERIVSAALYTLDAWRDALLRAEPLQARQEAQDKLVGSSLGPVEHPGTAYEGMGAIGRMVGRVLGWPLLLVHITLTRLARGDEERAERRRRAQALRVSPERDLAGLEAQAAGGYLAPMQAAALRGESVSSIREAALARFQLTDDGVLDSAPDSDLLGIRESGLIDGELSAHYTRALRGFGLIS